MKRMQGLGAVALLAAVMACEPGARKPDISATPQSTTIGTLSNGSLVAVDADHHAVVFLKPDGSGAQSVGVGQRPAQLAVRGNTVVVSNRGDRSISVVDADARRVVATIPVGVEPVGVAFVDDHTAVVALSGEQHLAFVDLDNRRVSRKVDLGQDRPTGVAVLPNGSVYVSHLLRGVLSVVDPTGFVRAVQVNLPTSGFPLNASMLSSMTVKQDGSEVGMGNVNLNNENPVPSDSGSPGYLGGPSSLPAVNPTLTQVNTTTEVMVHTEETSPEPTNSPGAPTDCFDCGGRGFQTSTSKALLRSDDRFQVNEPTAVAYLDGGRGIAVLARGSRNVFIWRTQEDGARGPLLAVAQVGHGADGLTVSADGRLLIVHNAFDLTLSIVDIPDLEPPHSNGVPFSTGRRDVTKVEEPSARTVAFAQLDLPADVAAGRRLFFDATLPGMTTGPGITCGTCHVEGRNDNRTWMFIDGPRNTPSLAGAAQERKGIATTTEPLHWRGELVTHLDLQRTVTEFMGGSGLSSEQLNQLAAFIDTIPSPDVALPEADAEVQLIARGEELFYDNTVACASCHSGAHFTDNLNHAVGTSDGLHDDFQTPVLHGLRQTAPYGHDGRYQSLEDLLYGLVRTNQMGKGDHLTDADIQALAAFLRSL